MSGVKKDMLLKVYSPKERGGSWAALGRLWAGFAGFLAVMCLLGLQGKGQLKMYVVPGGQIPRREQTVGRTTALQCCGGVNHCSHTRLPHKETLVNLSNT